MSQLLENTNASMSIQSAGSSSSPINNNQMTASVTNPTISGTPTEDSLKKDKINVTDTSSTQVPSNFDDVLICLFAGATAGALAKTAIAPLDRTKINFQIRKDVQYNLRAAVTFIQNTYHKEGLLGLWRGNSATMARIVPYAAIQFTAHEQWRKLLRVDQDGSNTKAKRFIAGSLAGITSQSLTYPLDLARARMAVTDKKGYSTLRQVFVRIWVEEGPRTFYRGYWPTILGVIPYAGTSFFTYETLKREYFQLTGNSKPNTLLSLAFGATAGAVGQTASYPLDIVRRRMQTYRTITHGEKPTFLKILIKVYKEEGIKNGFYKGLSMNWIKGPIAVGISFSTYDFIKELLRELFHLRHGRKEQSIKL